MFNASSLKCYKSPRKRDALRSGDAHEALRQLTWSALGAFEGGGCVFYFLGVGSCVNVLKFGPS